MRNLSAGNTLASLLVVAAIIMVALVGWLYIGQTKKGTPRPDGLGVTTPGVVRAQALDTVCKSNLKQIRDSITYQRTLDEEAPITLEGLRLPADVLACPIGKEPYRLEPDGRVVCTHPGHEGF